MEAEQDAELGNNVVRDKLLLGLMSISTEEILTEFVLVGPRLQIPLKKGESEQVCIGQVVKNGVAKDLQLLIVERQAELALPRLVSHGF